MSRRGNKWRVRGHARKEMDKLTSSEFKSMFRMSRDSFEKLLSLLNDKLTISERGKINAINSSGSYIEPKTKLAAALRFLAGGSANDIAFAFGLSISAFYKDNYFLWHTIAAIDKALNNICFPMTEPEKLSRIEEGFAKFSFYRLRGCVMAVDGWVVRTRQPFKTETQNITAYRNRKGFFGVVVIVGVDSQCRYLMLSCRSPGSTNDCIAWEYTSVYSQMHLLHAAYYIIGDEDFVNTKKFLAPYGGNNVSVFED